ncbi:Hypothetical predicted protein, partial [Pelobates cultripes]
YPKSRKIFAMAARGSGIHEGSPVLTCQHYVTIPPHSSEGSFSKSFPTSDRSTSLSEAPEHSSDTAPPAAGEENLGSLFSGGSTILSLADRPESPTPDHHGRAHWDRQS